MQPIQIQLSCQGTHCMEHPRMSQTMLHHGSSHRPCTGCSGHPSLHPSLPPPNPLGVLHAENPSTLHFAPTLALVILPGHPLHGVEGVPQPMPTIVLAIPLRKPSMECPRTTKLMPATTPTSQSTQVTIHMTFLQCQKQLFCLINRNKHKVKQCEETKGFAPSKTKPQK